MSSPQFSVLLPVYNGARYLTECIQSVLAQELDDFELCVVDDFSTDESRSILARVKDKRLKVIYSGRNSGLFPTLNLLVEISAAPLIHFLCQDDLMLPGCLETEHRAFSESLEPAMSVCQAGEIDISGRVLRHWAPNDLRLLSPSDAVQHLWYYGCFPGNLSTVALRRDIARDVGGFDPHYHVGGDYALWARVAEKYPIRLIQEHLVLIRDHPERLSRASSSCVTGIAEDRRVRAMLLPALPDPIRARAKRYVHMRQGVLDVHTFLHLLARLRLRDALRIVRIMGLPDFSMGLIWWTLTMDNRLWKPRPLFWVNGILTGR
jgi:glycosyltransferase involved in cell wall biosynthesis